MPIIYREHEESPSSQRSTSLRSILFIGALALTLVGGTWAANINISSGTSEFGQGVLATTACDPEFTIQPKISFSNGVNAQYQLSGLEITDLDSTSRDSQTGLGCENIVFEISIYGETGTALATYRINNYGSAIQSSDGSISASGLGTSNSSALLTLSTASIPSSSIARITVQSAAAAPRTFVLGDTGPGGGTVFYVNTNGFPCGATLSDTCKYIEYAPANWASGFPEWTTTTANGGWSDSYALSNGAVDPPIPMIDNCTKVIPGSSAIGAALKNTIAIAVCSSVNAAEHVRAYRGGGKSDWGIPTQLELSAMNAYRKNLYPNWSSVNDPFNAGISTIDAFWTSTGSGNGFRFEYLNRDTRGSLGPTNVNFTLLIKPVRAF